MSSQKAESKYPYKVLAPKYLNRLDYALKYPPFGKKMYRGKQYAIYYMFGSGLRDSSEERAAKAMAKEIRDYSPYGATWFKVGSNWVVGIRQWKR